MSTYLISLVAGIFPEGIRRPLPGHAADLLCAGFRKPPKRPIPLPGTADMLEFFEREIGVPYPWAKYYQVCVDDFVAGGMENTSLTILTDHTLHTADFENLHDSQGPGGPRTGPPVVRRSVTCKDWAHLWLNEGFATYYEQLYDGHTHGPRRIRSTGCTRGQGHHGPQPTKPTPSCGAISGIPTSNSATWPIPKAPGCCTCCALQLGEELYPPLHPDLPGTHPVWHGRDRGLERVIEELSGRSFDQFFDQWVTMPVTRTRRRLWLG